MSWVDLEAFGRGVLDLQRCVTCGVAEVNLSAIFARWVYGRSSFGWQMKLRFMCEGDGEGKGRVTVEEKWRVRERERVKVKLV